MSGPTVAYNAIATLLCYNNKKEVASNGNMSKRPTINFQRDWELRFGVEVTSRDKSTGKVSSVVCLFCRHFGREDSESTNRKRKSTANAKYFTEPWRSDNFSLDSILHCKQYHRLQNLFVELDAKQSANSAHIMI